MDLEVIPWDGSGGPVEGTCRSLLEGEGFGVFRWTDPPGADYTPHAHDRDESIWLLEGEMVFGAGGREMHLAPGDRLMLPAGTVHTVHVGPAGATYLIGGRG